jgi:DNA-binding LacI/PurR family transcriptional regulator
MAFYVHFIRPVWPVFAILLVAGFAGALIEVAFDEHEVTSVVETWRREGAPRAVFTYSDDYAVMFMRSLLDAEFRVPQEIALVGSDDLQICRLLRPTLSSIQFDIAFSTTRVAAFFHALIQGEIQGTPSIPHYSPKVVERSSS